MSPAPDTYCPLCGQAGRPRYSGLVDRMCGVPGDWGIAECSSINCDLMWVTPRPTDSEIPDFYRSYYTHEDAPGPQSSTIRERLRVNLYPTPMSARQLRHRRDEVLPRFLEVTGKSLLEIGCGNGVNLLALRSLGWEVDGHDLDEAAADVASKRLGRHIERGAVESVDWQGRTYDVVLTNHVLEHLSSPEAVLRVCVSLLKPGGVMVNFTPNARSLSRVLFGARWRGFEPPRHLQIFGPQSAEALLESAGLIVETVSSSTASDGYLASRSVLADDTGSRRFTAAIRIFVSTAAQLLSEAAALVRPNFGGELLVVGRKPIERSTEALVRL